MNEICRGKGNSNYKTGYWCIPHYCVDCGLELPKGSFNNKSHREGNPRCRSCSKKGEKNPAKSLEVRRKLKKSKIEYYKNHPEALANLRSRLSSPEMIESSLKNSFGIHCSSEDGLNFPTIQERDCYYWLRDELKIMNIIHNFKGRFDFLLNDKVVLEYHPCNWFLEKRTKKQYYKDRRKLLNELDHKDLKLVVMTSLGDKERVSIKRRIYEGALV